jgi:hypothetical protein
LSLPQNAAAAAAAADMLLIHRDVAALLKISSGEVSIALPPYFRSIALYLVSFDYCRQVLCGLIYAAVASAVHVFSMIDSATRAAQ